MMSGGTNTWNEPRPTGPKTMEFACSRNIEIDMAHRVMLHGSKCRNLHGHRYVVILTVRGELKTEGSETGMVKDFSFLKQVLMEVIDAKYDHACCLQEDDVLLKKLRELYDLPEMKSQQNKLIGIPYTPTAENLCYLWHEEIKQRFKELEPEIGKIKIAMLEVHETPNCRACYYE